MFFGDKEDSEEQAMEVIDIIKEEIYPNPTAFFHGLTVPVEADEEDDEEDEEEEA